MKKFVFILAMVLLAAVLIAGTSRAVAVPNSGNSNPPTHPTREVFYTEDFESGATGWTHYDGAVPQNMWHIHNNSDAQGNCWWMGDADGNGGYHDHQYLVLDTGNISISTENSTLTFKMRHGLEAPGVSGDYDGWDSFNIRISTNSGVTYSVIPDTTAILSPVYDFESSYAFGSEHGEGVGVPGWGGMRTDWTLVTVDLSQYLVAGAATVKIRFAFASDPAYNTDDEPELFGVMVDDIQLADYTNNGVDDGVMTYGSLVPSAGDFWHLATDASAPSPTHIMTCINNQGTYAPMMLDYLESPEITLPAAATQIVADFQLKGTFTDTGTFPDVDYFGWEVYHDGQWHYMSNPYDDPNGMNYVYSSAPDAWASMVLSYSLDGDITAFAGDPVRFRWYFQSNDDVSGTPLQIDDFQIFSVTAAPAPPNLVYPVNGQTGLPYTGFDLDWTANSQGALPQYYTVYMDQTEANLEIDTFNPLYISDNLTVSLYNPVAAGLVTFASNQRWYWRVGASITGQEEALSEIFRFDIVDAATVITTFPWDEGFESDTFPPTGWTVAQIYQDGDAVNWTANSNASYVHSGAKSAMHAYSTAVPDPGQNGWLISPAVQLPATGTCVFSFWNYNLYASYAVYNGLLINTTNDPYDAGWAELWEQDATTTGWAQKTADISSYAGQIVYFAFKYTGYDANNWYVDDVLLNVYTEDLNPPTIAHLPHLNTLVTDSPYVIEADIADDAIWNNPIASANLYYSLDGGLVWSAAIPMILDVAPTYYASIPAQPLGSTITYKMDATDSEANTVTSPNYAFTVDDPTWLNYDDGLSQSFSGFPNYVWGPMIYYENPLYGTGIPLQILAVDGAVHNNNAGNPPTVANLHIYEEDLEGNLTDAMTPLPVTFTHRTRLETDLTAYNVQIDSPWFWISYEDLPLGCYFMYDDTYDYTTMYLMISDDGIYTSTSTGEWCIGAYVQSVAAGPEAPMISIDLVAGHPELTWAAVTGANSYKVYGSNDPYAADPWTLLGSVGTPGFSYTGTAPMQFFKVTSDTETPTRDMIIGMPAEHRSHTRMLTMPTSFIRER